MLTTMPTRDVFIRAGRGRIIGFDRGGFRIRLKSFKCTVTSTPRLPFKVFKNRKQYYIFNKVGINQYNSNCFSRSLQNSKHNYSNFIRMI